jgi:cation diffusion facilitator family transporter
MLVATSDNNERAIRRVLILTLGLNLLVAAAKLVVGFHFHLLSLTADGLHSTLDGLNNVVGMLMMWAAFRPPDPGHPYGHRKLETFAALAVGVSLGVMGAGLAREALLRARDGVAPHSHPLAFSTAILTLVVNLGVSWYEARRGRELKSPFLLADAQHTRGDVLVTVAVLIALLAVQLKQPLLDVAAALGIAVFIGWTAVGIIRRSLQVLADAVVLDPDRVVEIATSIAGVRGCHKVRSRGMEGHVFVDLHIQVDPDMKTQDSHALGHRVAAEVKDKLGAADVLVHVEPDQRAR